jgi:hypothetical protein
LRVLKMNNYGFLKISPKIGSIWRIKTYLLLKECFRKLKIKNGAL